MGLLHSIYVRGRGVFFINTPAPDLGYKGHLKRFIFKGLNSYKKNLFVQIALNMSIAILKNSQKVPLI